MLHPECDGCSLPRKKGSREYTPKIPLGLARACPVPSSQVPNKIRKGMESRRQAGSICRSDAASSLSRRYRMESPGELWKPLLSASHIYKFRWNWFGLECSLGLKVFTAPQVVLCKPWVGNYTSSLQGNTKRETSCFSCSNDPCSTFHRVRYIQRFHVRIGLKERPASFKSCKALFWPPGQMERRTSLLPLVTKILS